MAYTNRVHGDYQPVANYDQPEYNVGDVNAVTASVTVQPQGPKLTFATITRGSGSFTTAEVKKVVDTIQQLSVVYIYEYGNTTMAVAFYSVSSWADVTATGAGSLDAAITEALNGTAVSIAASATFTN